MHIKLQLTGTRSVNLLYVCCESAVFLGTNTVNLQKQERLGNQMGQLVNYHNQNWNLCLMTTHGVWETLLLERQASKSGTQVSAPPRFCLQTELLYTQLSTACFTCEQQYSLYAYQYTVTRVHSLLCRKSTSRRYQEQGNSRRRC